LTQVEAFYAPVAGDHRLEWSSNNTQLLEQKA
jgi:hypothetical protein